MAQSPPSQVAAPGNGRSRSATNGIAHAPAKNGAHAMLTQAHAVVRLDPDARVVALDLTLADPDVVAFLEEAPEAERTELAVRALRVGALALRDARVTAKADFVAKEFDRMRQDFQGQMDRWFGDRGEVTLCIRDTFGDDGQVARRMEAFFGDGGRFEAMVEEFAGERGALPRAIHDAVGDDGSLPRTMEAFLGERGRLRQELDREFGEEGGRLYRILNPEDAATPLGRFRADLEARFDPKREGSAMWDLKQDLRSQIEALRRDLDVQDAVAEEREKGHGKGFDFEEVVLQALEPVAAGHHDRLEHVGTVKGAVGDVGDLLIALDPGTTAGVERRIVVEVKDRSVGLTGKNSIFKELDAAMQNRDAHFGIAVVEAGHANGWAPLRYAAPHHLLVALDKDDPDPLPLRAAYTLARSLVASRAAQREAEVDVEGMLAGLDGIRAQLENVRAMKTHLTGAKRNIDNVNGMLDDMRSRVMEQVEDLARKVRSGGDAAACARQA